MMAPSAAPASVRHFTAAGNTLPGGFSFGGGMGPVAEEQDEKDDEHVLGRNTLKLKSQAIVRNHTEGQLPSHVSSLAESGGHAVRVQRPS